MRPRNYRTIALREDTLSALKEISGEVSKGIMSPAKVVEYLVAEYRSKKEHEVKN